MTELQLAAPVGTGGVEDAYARLDRGRDRLDCKFLVALRAGRHSHAAESDAELLRFKPSRATQTPRLRPPPGRSRMHLPCPQPRPRWTAHALILVEGVDRHAYPDAPRDRTDDPPVAARVVLQQEASTVAKEDVDV